ncbi:MAG TPA: DUF3997 domain-containing protein [Bacteroidia bacterium]|nr:DUF3997 domain-containing protein [Bacteroidia bacterium]
MKKWIIAILVILLSGILFFMIWGQDDQDLGDNYYYLPKYEAIDVGFPGGAIVYKSTQKHLYSEIKIYGNVKEVNFNKEFIIAIQNADTSYLEKADSDIFEKNFSNYYIIVKKSDLVYGPYSKEEYIQKRDELGIPEELKLKE